MHTTTLAIAAPPSDTEGWVAAVFNSETPTGTTHGRPHSKSGGLCKRPAAEGRALLDWKQAAPIPQGEERGQDKAEGKEVRAGHRSQALPHSSMTKGAFKKEVQLC